MKNLIVILGIILSYNSFGQLFSPYNIGVGSFSERRIGQDSIEYTKYDSLGKIASIVVYPTFKYDTTKVVGITFFWDKETFGYGVNKTYDKLLVIRKLYYYGFINTTPFGEKSNIIKTLKKEYYGEPVWGWCDGDEQCIIDRKWKWVEVDINQYDQVITQHKKRE